MLFVLYSVALYGLFCARVCVVCQLLCDVVWFASCVFLLCLCVVRCVVHCVMLPGVFVCACGVIVCGVLDVVVSLFVIYCVTLHGVCVLLCVFVCLRA